jgi:type III restriction enzyme
MVERYGFDDHEVIVTHSGRRPTEAELERIVELDTPGNTARVVVQVQQLTEGWDVRRVYVMAPLRTMGTFQYAIQNLRRGLRLPVGERIGDEELDKLDVVLFGRETAAEIIDRARKEFGEPETGVPLIDVTEAGDEPDQPVGRREVVPAATRANRVDMAAGAACPGGP